MHDALVVADDLTGAADTGNRFATRGYATEVVASSSEGVVRSPSTGEPSAAAEDVEGPPVLVVDTDSRYAPANEAAERVHEAVEAHPAAAVYKKVDSTLRGNLVDEIDAAVDAADAALAVVAPAFPATGRTTVGGFHLVDGVPVAETEAGADPDRPVTGSYLPSLLAASAHPVEHLPLDVVGEGAGAVQSALADAVDAHGTAVVACDATRGRHLRAVAAGAAGVGAGVVHVGSGGLAAYVHLPAVAGPVLGVVGSATPKTFAQVDAVGDPAVVVLDGPTAVTDLDAAARAAADEVAATLSREGRVLLTAARDHEDVAATLAAARERGVPERDARDAVASALGRAATDVATRVEVGGFFLTGGDVAGQTLDALGADAVALTGRSVGAGVPLGEVQGGVADGKPVVTKAGAFGDDETIVNCLAFLAAHNG